MRPGTDVRLQGFGNNVIPNAIVSTFGTRPANQLSVARTLARNGDGGWAVNYRTFIDSSGKRWEVWMVTPAAAERRKVDRRASTKPGDLPEGFADRRRTPERRRGPFRRNVSVATEFSNGWLCFECDGEKRRLAPVPEGWQEAGPDRLSSWLQAAKRVVKCGP